MENQNIYQQCSQVGLTLEEWDLLCGYVGEEISNDVSLLEAYEEKIGQIEKIVDPKNKIPQQDRMYIGMLSDELIYLKSQTPLIRERLQKITPAHDLLEKFVKSIKSPESIKKTKIIV